jgi:hypothetical protein
MNDILILLLSFILSVWLLYTMFERSAKPTPKRPPHHDDGLLKQPDYLTRDHWRDRGRQDPLSNEQWSECERNRGFPIPNNGPAEETYGGPAIAPPGAYWTIIEPTPDEPWITTPPERGALVLVKMRPAPSAELLPKGPIIYASLSVTGMYLYAIDGTVHRWADALGWKPAPKDIMRRLK